jgi:ribosomal protein S18 acetylase RimI-like enzyme
MIRILDVTDADAFGLVPPCADPGFDHRSCDYWEDADRGSKAARLSWLDPSAAQAPARRVNPFGGDDDPLVPEAPANPFVAEPGANPFAPTARSTAALNPLLEERTSFADNPFAPAPKRQQGAGRDGPRKLGLLTRGLAVFGSYAKLLLVDERAAVYAQFGPLSAYPRALRLRELYPQLPDAPLPAVITCIATSPAERGSGLARQLVAAVCADLAERGFAAVEAYPQAGARPDSTSAATPEFWLGCGFSLAVADERFPVVRRELG